MSEITTGVRSCYSVYELESINLSIDIRLENSSNVLWIFIEGFCLFLFFFAMLT